MVNSNVVHIPSPFWLMEFSQFTEKTHILSYIWLSMPFWHFPKMESFKQTLKITPILKG